MRPIYTAALASLFLLVFAKSAYADNLAGLAFVLFLIVHFAIIISVFSSAAIKYAFVLRWSGIPLRSLQPLVTAEIVIFIVFNYVFIYANSSWLGGRGFDMWITSILSYISVDIAMSYFQDAFAGHRKLLPMITSSLLYMLIISFIVYFPNYKLLIKHHDKRDSRRNLWIHSYLLSTITPIIYCIAIIALMIYADPDGKQIIADQENRPDVKSKMLREATAAGNKRLVQVSLIRGADVDAEISPGNGTVMHYMLQENGNVDILKLLLKKGANVNAKDGQGLTPLMIACSGCPVNIEIVRLLIDSGADVDARTSDGRTALMLSNTRCRGKQYGLTDTITAEILLDHGVDPNIRDYRDSTALKEAQQSGNDKLVKLLLARGAISDN